MYGCALEGSVSWTRLFDLLPQNYGAAADYSAPRVGKHGVSDYSGADTGRRRAFRGSDTTWGNVGRAQT